MAIALYNPKYLESKGSRIENTANVDRFVWSHAVWNLKVNEIKKFPDEVARGMLKNIPFLVEVTPKNVEKIKKEQAVKAFKCPECSFETDYKMALSGHMKSHKKSGEHEQMLSGIEEAAPTRSYRNYKPKPVTPEQKEGIPDTSQGPAQDADGVEFYGGGLQTDEPPSSMRIVRKGQPGVFRG